jgi:UDP-3-O-[3-hydroxymyristoyl] glucosamine N-acyltransferase
MASGHSVREILEWSSGRLLNGDVLEGGGEGIRVERPAPLAASRAGDLAFFFSRDYEHELATAAPGVLITGEAFAAPLQAQAGRLPFWKKTAVIACKDPYYAMAVLSERFAKELSTVAHLPGSRKGMKTEIHPSAVVDPRAVIGEGAAIGAHCVIEAGARIGAGTVLYPRAYIGPDATVGEDCVFFPGVTLYEWTQVGNRVRIHAGSVLGSDGFGYAPRIEGGVPTDHRKIYHLGRVVVGDDVEIGADTMIDRATLGETRIGSKVKLDNHVHIGHNSVLGEGTILCGAAATAGGTVIGKFVYVGGLAGVGNKAVVGDYAKIGGMSMIDSDVPAGSVWIGNPMRPHREHFKVHAILNKLLKERKSGNREEK